MILFADLSHDAPLIEVSARLERGLPVHVLPFEVNEITRIGPDLVSACLASVRPGHDLAGLGATLGSLRALTGPMGLPDTALRVIAADDPADL